MKKTILTIGVIAVTLSSCVSKKKYTELMKEKEGYQTESIKQQAEIEAIKNKKMDLNNELDKVSYALGVNIANSVKTQGLTEINSKAVAAAFDATFNGVAPQLDMQQSQQILQEYFGKIAAEQAMVSQKIGADFLAKNAKREGVITLPSGLQYMILKEGTGAKPTLQDKVKTHYHGTLIDGTVFDSSVDRGEPFQFNTESGVIQGWLEVSKLMPVGSKWEIYLPYNLAYGERGAGGKITPFATLIFQIEILEIVK